MHERVFATRAELCNQHGALLMFDECSVDWDVPGFCLPVKSMESSRMSLLWRKAGGGVAIGALLARKKPQRNWFRGLMQQRSVEIRCLRRGKSSHERDP